MNRLVLLGVVALAAGCNDWNELSEYLSADLGRISTVGGLCERDENCQGTRCDVDLGLCAMPSCADGLRNGDESAIDCGSPTDSRCGRCRDGLHCLRDSDCLSEACIGNVCTPPSCTDSRLNGDETDLDCGGPLCVAKCAIAKSCRLHSDCATSFCGTDQKCAPERCGDHTQNGAETDVDCGGACPKCPSSKSCLLDEDCQSGACSMTSKRCK